jgi:hypothetical protein
MFKVYWTDPLGTACSQDFLDLGSALAHSKFLRESGRTFVTMVSENPDCVSLPGVDAVEDGCTPDGVPYTWRKRR